MTDQGDFGRCAACRKPTHLHLLSSKPGDRMECWECYGPGFMPGTEGATDAEGDPMRSTMVARAIHARLRSWVTITPAMRRRFTKQD